MHSTSPAGGETPASTRRKVSCPCPSRPATPTSSPARTSMSIGLEPSCRQTPRVRTRTLSRTRVRAATAGRISCPASSTPVISATRRAGGGFLTGQRCHRLARAHHGDPVGDLLDLVHAVRDEQDAGTCGSQLAHNLEQPVAGSHVQGGGGLVENQDARLADERPRDAYGLPVAERQPARHGVQARVVEHAGRGSRGHDRGELNRERCVAANRPARARCWSGRICWATTGSPERRWRSRCSAATRGEVRCGS